MRWKNILGIALLLSFGFMLGANYDQYMGAPPRADSRNRSRSSMTSRLEAELIRELKLDEKQQLILKEAIEDARDKLHELSHEYRPRVWEILNQARDSLVPHLNSDQLKLRQEMIRQKEERRHERSRSQGKKESEKKKSQSQS